MPMRSLSTRGLLRSTRQRLARITRMRSPVPTTWRSAYAGRASSTRQSRCSVGPWKAGSGPWGQTTWTLCRAPAAWASCCRPEEIRIRRGGSSLGHCEASRSSLARTTRAPWRACTTWRRCWRLRVSWTRPRLCSRSTRRGARRPSAEATTRRWWPEPGSRLAALPQPPPGPPPPRSAERRAPSAVPPCRCLAALLRHCHAGALRVRAALPRCGAAAARSAVTLWNRTGTLPPHGAL
mmetsp:Transcript_69391/g.225349  ORF Transcript_69391/g.225349 Transcript_69391/m.225349 type:complete len:237 (+) Transcript_69391:2352-3062(+)